MEDKILELEAQLAVLQTNYNNLLIIIGNNTLEINKLNKLVGELIKNG